MVLLASAFASTGCESAFADRVVAYVPGDDVFPTYSNPKNALGEPDFSEGLNAVSLGNFSKGAASLTLSFPRLIVDGEGDDIYVHERGPAAEPTWVEVSRDGKVWERVGRIEGSTRGIDLGANPALIGRSFAYLRLIAIKTGARAPWAGPDIDAVELLTCPARSNS